MLLIGARVVSHAGGFDPGAPEPTLLGGSPRGDHNAGPSKGRRTPQPLTRAG